MYIHKNEGEHGVSFSARVIFQVAGRGGGAFHKEEGEEKEYMYTKLERGADFPSESVF